MPRIPAIASVAGMHDVGEYDEEATQTYLEGALVLLDANEEITECGADPAAILGFALHNAKGHPIDGKCSIQRLTEGQKFWIDGDNAPVAGDLNQSYGVTKDADGVWHLDGTKTAGSARLYVHKIDTDRNRYEVSVLAANRQIAP